MKGEEFREGERGKMREIRWGEEIGKGGEVKVRSATRDRDKGVESRGGGEVKVRSIGREERRKGGKN